jgi:hypothetical protein
MRRLGIYTLAALLAGVGLARPDPMSLPDRAVIEQFGERQLLELRPNPDGSPKSYTIYALTRPAGIEQMMRPLDGEGRVVDTASRVVPLEPGVKQTVTQYYTNQQVAYLRVDFTVQVRDGSLTHNGQVVLTNNPSISGVPMWQHLLWGAAFIASGGLIALFWLPPMGTMTTTYNTVIPLDGRWHRFTFGGGGGCGAARGFYAPLYLYSRSLQPGGIYHSRLRIWCAGGTTGIAGENFTMLRPLQVIVDPAPAGIDPGVAATAGWAQTNSVTVYRDTSRYNMNWATEIPVVNHMNYTLWCDENGNCVRNTTTEVPVGTVRTSSSSGHTYRYVQRTRPGMFSIPLHDRRTLGGTVEQRPATRTDRYGREVTVNELVIHPDPGPMQTIRVVNRWERVSMLNLEVRREYYNYNNHGHYHFQNTPPPNTTLLRNGAGVWSGGLGQHTMEVTPGNTYSLNWNVGQTHRFFDDGTTRYYWRVHSISGLPFTAQAGTNHTGQITWRPRTCWLVSTWWQCQDR